MEETKKHPLLPPELPNAKNRRKQYRRKRTTTFLIRCIIQDLNRTMTIQQIAWYHGVTRQWVYLIAKKLRAEGFKIPEGFPGRKKYEGRLSRLIYQFKIRNPELLKGNLGCSIHFANKILYLDSSETEALIKLIPKVSKKEVNIKYQYGLGPMMEDSTGELIPLGGNNTYRSIRNSSYFRRKPPETPPKPAVTKLSQIVGT